MKKKMYVAGIMALALVFGTCMFFEPDPGDKREVIEFDSQGRRLVTLDIDTGGRDSRNLDLTIAQVAVNYYEVVFFDPLISPDYYRASGPKGKILTIKLPVDFALTTDATNAIAFAGFWDRSIDDRTLLATGNVIAYREDGGDEDVPAVGYPISEDTRAIKFRLYPIETKFGAKTNNAVADHSDTSFKITSPDEFKAIEGFYPAGIYESGYATSGGVVGRNTTIAHLTINENNGITRERPFWRLPSKAEGGTYFGNDINPQATFEYKVGPDHEQAIHVVIANPDFEFDSWAILTDNSDDGLTAVQARPVKIGTSSAIAWNTIAVPDAFGVAYPNGFTTPLGPIDIEIALYQQPVHKGFCLLVINLPVVAMSPDVPNGELWTLRNGMYDYEIHDNAILSSLPAAGYGTTGDYGVSLGGALMLCVGDVQSVNARAIKILFERLPRQ
ncbi:MAG: hypothetical protein LBH97_01790 [Treponema sp.]|jgi:hypothetical protein|nr:hypothetical protein [Treponema sp.]